MIEGYGHTKAVAEKQLLCDQTLINVIRKQLIIAVFLRKHNLDVC